MSSLPVQQDNCVGTNSLSINFAETTNSGFLDYFVCITENFRR
jgi:hypothetical protein